MMIDDRKQSAEYVIREVARRVVPMTLMAIGDIHCRSHAFHLEDLPDNVTMADIVFACDAAAVCAYSTGHGRAVRDNAWVAAAYACHDVSAAASASVINDYTISAYYGGGAGAAEYEDILAEARSLFSAS